jgi:hypothetical protein
MRIAPQEWSIDKKPGIFRCNEVEGGWRMPPTSAGQSLAMLYRRLSAQAPDIKTKAGASDFLKLQLANLEAVPAAAGDCPEAPEDLQVWMENASQLATAKYCAYLKARQQGAPRSYFGNRAHALYVLRLLAPTKLVDGAWLYGLLRYWENPRYANLIRIYLEELGNGQPEKNHVLLYRSLMSRYGLDLDDDLPDAAYAQGVTQLALAWNAEDFLPEILGFNLGYEQLPLHLLITAYELNELGIDPYYFTLHVTVDNAQTGHALRAVHAVQEAMPRLRHDPAFWHRVQQGCRLSCMGMGAADVIRSFDIGQEALRIFSRKSKVGRGRHSDYCKVGGRTINDWLGKAEDMPALMAALIKNGWIRPGEPVEHSRFWGLLQGPEADMFGVFSPYELQLIHDWIRGPDSADGAACATTNGGELLASPRRASYRAQKALEEQGRSGKVKPVSLDEAQPGLLDADLKTMADLWPGLERREQTDLLVKSMAPSEHWTPAGLLATRIFASRLA